MCSETTRGPQNALMSVLTVLLVLGSFGFGTEKAQAMDFFDPIALLDDAVIDSNTDIDLTKEEILEMPHLDEDLFGIFPVKHLDKTIIELVDSWQIEGINVNGRDTLLSIHCAQAHEWNSSGGVMRTEKSFGINATKERLKGGWSWELVGVTFNDREIDTFQFSPMTGATITLVDSDESMTLNVKGLIMFFMNHSGSIGQYFEEYDAGPEGNELFDGLVDTLAWFKTTATDNVLELVEGSPWLDSLANVAPANFGGVINFKQMLGAVSRMTINNGGMHVVHNSSNTSNGNGFSYQKDGKHINFGSRWTLDPSAGSGFGLSGVSAGMHAAGKMRWARIYHAVISGNTMTLTGDRARIRPFRFLGRKSVKETIQLGG